MADSRQAGVTFSTVWLNRRLETRKKILEQNSLGLQRLERASRWLLQEGEDRISLELTGQSV